VCRECDNEYKREWNREQRAKLRATKTEEERRARDREYNRLWMQRKRAAVARTALRAGSGAAAGIGTRAQDRTTGGRMILVGDARAIPLPDACVAAVVTDPPYELAFMGKRWDASGVASRSATWREVLRVLRPGGRLLAFGAPRTSHRIWCAIEDAGFVIEDTAMWLFGSGFPKHKSKLKPAYEPICVARKGPVSALNIDGCRIGMMTADEVARSGRSTGGYGGGLNPVSWKEDRQQPAGRWPANVLLDEDAARLLDEQSGEREVSGTAKLGKVQGGAFGAGFLAGAPRKGGALPNDSGGASRFFYTAKASRSEREHGLEGAPQKRGGSTVDGFTEDRARGLDRNRPVANHHPTVKPVDLMRYLVRLVTQPGDLVLDPFTGSGSTGVACIEEGRRFVGVELSPEYAEIARRRLYAAQPNLFAEGAA
jgi:DNA modification methylase